MSGYIQSVTVTSGGSGYSVAPVVSFQSATGYGAEATAILGTGLQSGQVIAINVTNPGGGYSSPVTVILTGESTTPAVAVAIVKETVLNSYFAQNKVVQGANSEQNLLEDLIIESLQIYGVEVLYIPRTLVSKDNILGEDRLSKFENAYPIEVYFEQVDNFDGQGSFIQKFGLMVEQSATLVMARKRWNDLIGTTGTTILPNRPAEGDLIYFPLTKGLFEIKFVEHKDPFYQLGKLYTYKLQIELFQYSSEKLETGISEIDVFETIKTFDVDTNISKFGYISNVTITNSGSGYVTPPLVDFISTTGTGATATAILGTGINAGKVVAVNVTNGGTGYTDSTTVQFTGGNTTPATATVTVKMDIDQPDSYGDNRSFQIAAAQSNWDETNPFGDA